MKGIRSLIGVVLVLVMLRSVVSPVMAKTSDAVNQSEAKAVVEKFIARISMVSNFKDWKNAKIGKVIVAYDVDESKSAYIFELVKDGKYVGYIVVSAKKTNYPILEFSKGKSPLMRAKELGIKVEEVYYLSGLTYIFEEKGKYYDLNKKKVDFNKIKESVKEVMKDEKVRKHLANRALEAKKQWEMYSSDAVTLFSYKEKYIPDVPAFLWDDGCSPTSAAMVLEYWGEHGYPNLDHPDWWYFEPTDINNGTQFDDPPNEHTDLTEELHYAMGTDNETGFTWWFYIDDRINKVCKKYGYSDWASNQWLPQPSWSDVTNEINASRPFVLSMWYGGTESGHDQPYGDHTVACVGYAINTNTNERFVMVQDTWDLGIHYLAWGNWWAISITWVRPS